MAKKRKRKKNLSKSLKYEVYGILIIVFSIISMAGRGVVPGIGSVGRSLSYMTLFLAGRLYFVIPIICIYVGLYVMIKRGWPSTWSYKKTGILLFICAGLIHFHLELFQLTHPTGGQSFAEIVGQPISLLKDQLSQEIEGNVYLRHLGGGFLGAILYGTLYVLLDNLGTQFIMWTLALIAFICLTGLSYAELIQKSRNGVHKVIKQLRIRLKEAKETYRQRQLSRKDEDHHLDLAMAEEVDEEAWTPEDKPNKRKLFFSLFQSDESSSSKPNDNGFDDEFEATADHVQEEVVYTAGDQAEDLAPWEELQTEPAEEPLFRDFQDTLQVQKVDTSQPKQEINEQPDSVPSDSDAVHEVQSVETGAATDSHDEDFMASFDSADTESKEDVKPYQLPNFDLLALPPEGSGAGNSLNYRANARKLEATLESFGVRARVLEVVRGPSVTRYEIQPDIGVKVSRIVSLTDDIALALAAKDIRMEAPIPGKSAIGIEVPNSEVSIVTMREVMETKAFLDSEAKLSIALGRDISGQPIVANLAKMPHLLVAGATGSGKSVCINGIITSVLYKAKPDEVKFLMIDPKMVELNMYNGIPHLLAPVVTDPKRASLALKKVVKEMEHRYELFSKSGTRNIEGYNHFLRQSGKSDEVLPLIVVIIDELADLMMVAANDVEDAICRLAQMARAAGIHLIIATQRPSVDVITGLIKANVPSRIAFGVSSQVDSRTILDMVGAEKLLGRGDMLFMPVGSSKPIRVQGAFLSDQEVENVVRFVSQQEKVEYKEDMVPQVDDVQEIQDEVEDELFDQAVQIILDAKQASVSLLQRRMRIGYTRAARLIDSMEAKGIVGPYEGSKPREVLISSEQYNQQQTNDKLSS